MMKFAPIAGLLFLLPLAAHAQTTEDSATFFKAVNQNNDQTLSLKELNSYATKKFEKLNTKGTKTLSREELGDRISDADFDVANKGHRKDRTLSEREFKGYVDSLFRQANSKGKRTLNADELGSPAGQKLIKLLQ